MNFSCPIIIKWQSNWPINSEKIHIDHVSRHENVYTNVLTSLVATLVFPPGATKYVTIGNRDLLCSKVVLETGKVHHVGLSLER